jgi:hypothetical protein
LKALSYFGEGNLRTVPKSARKRLEAAVHAVDSETFPHFLPRTESADADAAPASHP